MNTPTFGSDPEVMLKDNERGGRIVSSIPILKRDKFNPHLLSNGLRVYADNLLAEFSHPPFANSEDGVDRFRSYFKDIKRFIGPRFSIHPQAAHHFSISELGKRDPEAMEWKAGCEDNFSPYIEGPNPKVVFKDELRTGSFHIHIGHEALDTLYKKADFVKLLDIYLGCSSILFDKDNSNTVRRQYYGRAGEFRPTEYGVEYRVLGNYALRHPELVRLVIDIAEFCCSLIEKGEVNKIISIKGIQMHAQLAINQNYAGGAKRVLDAAGLPAMLLKRATDTYVIPTFDTAWGLN